MKKTYISLFLRKTGFLHLADKIWFHRQKISNAKSNKQFKKQYPEIALPPDYLMYEAYKLDYKNYFFDGKITAGEYFDIFKEHINVENARILEWGCGPGRIIRHLPEVAKKYNCKVYGTDYNKQSIEWCKEQLADITFSLNNLNPPLPYADSFFEVVYGISIFTHLSENLHYEWFNELMRILKPSGILMISTQGEAFMEKLTEEEQILFKAGELVVRGNVKEGHRVYSAFQPEKFMIKLAEEQQVAAFYKGKANGNPQQDIWIIRKI